MVIKESVLYSLDNSGVKKAKCFHIFFGSNKNFAYLGDKLRISLKKSIYSKNLNKKYYFGLFLNSKKNQRRLNGHFIKFDFNKVIILSEQHLVIGTRILGPIAKEIKFYDYGQLLAMAFSII